MKAVFTTSDTGHFFFPASHLNQSYNNDTSTPTDRRHFWDSGRFRLWPSGLSFENPIGKPKVRTQVLSRVRTHQSRKNASWELELRSDTGYSSFISELTLIGHYAIRDRSLFMARGAWRKKWGGGYESFFDGQGVG